MKILKMFWSIKINWQNYYIKKILIQALKKILRSVWVKYIASMGISVKHVKIGLYQIVSIYGEHGKISSSVQIKIRYFGKKLKQWMINNLLSLRKALKKKKYFLLK